MRKANDGLDMKNILLINTFMLNNGNDYSIYCSL